MNHTRKLALGVAGTLVVAAGGAWATAALTAVISAQGSTAGEYFGLAVAVAGDVDADGVPDVIVGAPYGDYAIVVSGADGSTIHTVKGNSGDEFGLCVAGAGDTDGDGHDDFLVGAPSFKGGLGAAFLYSGADGSELQAFYGDNSGDYQGCSVASAGDVDADGVPDLIVGARYGLDPNQQSPGYVKVISGKSYKLIHQIYGDTSGDEFGASVCGIGDVNGDKQSEFAVGAEYYVDGKGRTTGLVRIFDGASSKTITSLDGDYDYDGLGGSLAPAGDVNGDGTPDVVAGAQYGQDAKGNVPGWARVYSGSDWSTIHTFYGDADYDGMGRGLAGAADFDGDGVADLAIGAPGMVNANGDASGAVRIFSGKDGSEIQTVFGEKADDWFGYAVAFTPDLTSDGVPDLLVGAPFNDAGGDDAGSAALYAEDTPKGPSGTVVIDGDAPATGTTDVTLTLSWTAGAGKVVQMRLRNAGGAWGDWIDAAESVVWTIDSEDGAQTVEVQFLDDLGSTSGVASDTVVLDTTAPSGTVAIDGGAAWARGAGVTLTLTSSDSGTGTAFVRARDQGGTFGAWTPATSSLPWTLPAGNGARTVEVEFQDAVGNVSSVASDSISVDAAAPTGSLLIASGVDLVTGRNVTLSFPASDTGGSGLAEMRLRRGDVTTWGAWAPFAATASWSLAPGDGTKEVHAQFRDAAGNESAVAVDTIVLDETNPSIVSVGLHAPKPYYMPLAEVAFDLAATDGEGGTGVDAARTTWDDGATWTPWTAVPGDGIYVPERPTLEGAAAAQIVVRDRAGNVSAISAPIAVFFVDPTPPDLRSGGSAKGGMDGQDDVDVIAIDLVKGDSLTVGVKAVSIPKKQSFFLSTDLANPTGDVLVLDRFPATSKTQGIKGFVAPATGRYLLVVRNADALGTATGSYTLNVAVKHAKANAAGKGTADAGEFAFEAAAGSTFSGTLKGAGIDPASVVIEGPDGAVPAVVKLKKGVATISPVQLTAGTGVYKVRFTATGPVAFTWKSALPKANTRVTEE